MRQKYTALHSIVHNGMVDDLRPVIVVIDDEADIRDLVSFKLHSMGYAVHTAADGAAGLALCRELEPRLAIVDGSMPVMDGLEFLATLRGCESPALRDLPVVMLSARVQPSDVLAGISAGGGQLVWT